MDIGNGTGSHMVKMKEENKKRIISFFGLNPGSTKMECSKALNLSYQTVLTLVKEIMEKDK